MFTFNVDLGQLIIAGLIGIVGYFVKHTIDKVESRLDKNENAMFVMSNSVQRLIGNLEVSNERRKTTRQ